MRKLYYRLARLRVWPQDGGVAYEAWIMVNGLGRAARGRCAKRADLHAAIMADVARLYTLATGSPLPEPDGQLPLL